MKNNIEQDPYVWAKRVRAETASRPVVPVIGESYILE
jgi:hypothetical protein